MRTTAIVLSLVILAAIYGLYRLKTRPTELAKNVAQSTTAKSSEDLKKSKVDSLASQQDSIHSETNPALARKGEAIKLKAEGKKKSQTGLALTPQDSAETNELIQPESVAESNAARASLRLNEAASEKSGSANDKAEKKQSGESKGTARMAPGTARSEIEVKDVQPAIAPRTPGGSTGRGKIKVGAKSGIKPTKKPASLVSTAGYSMPNQDGATIYFSFNSAELTEDGKLALAYAARRLGDNQTIILMAHTDGAGAKEVNNLIANARAAEIARFLKTLQIPSERIEYVTVGSLRPVASDYTPLGRMRNRRVEVYIGGS